jgi:hypothetical protein
MAVMTSDRPVPHRAGDIEISDPDSGLTTNAVGRGRHASRILRISATDYAGPTMSKKTNKRKMKARRKKANHGKKPNAGR